MTINSERQLRTGGDPRTLAGYAALREEMNKLTHPARPDVNWQHAETLCLSLFGHNGGATNGCPVYARPYASGRIVRYE